MSIWDKEFGGQRARLQNLPERTLRWYLGKCIQHAFETRRVVYSSEVSQHGFRLFEEEVNLVISVIERHSRPTDIENRIDRFESMSIDESSPDYYVPGWRYLLRAIAALYEYFSECSVELAMYIVDAAYQSVCEDELLEASGGEGLVGEEILAVEGSSAMCQEEIAFQLDYLRKCETGEEPRPFGKQGS